ncbi:MAG: MFS transporter [Patescibacteria group bacterium]|nr:MFS transporter [Patescibacteria group bacterium]
MPKTEQREELHVAGESQELALEWSIGRWMRLLAAAFPAFEDRNYRLYFGGQVVSLIGTWLQTVAQGWLVLQLTDSAFWVGAVSALSSLPILFFALFGGVIVDRFSRKRILYLTQLIPMLLAAILGVLTLLDIVTLAQICALAFLLGLVNAIDIPARHAFVADLMDRRRLASAIALNSVTFNVSRVVGPSIAGTLITFIGVGGTFLVNAVSFIAVVAALMLITARTRAPAEHPAALKAIADGLAYTFSRRILRVFMIVAGVVAVFGWSYVSILPVVAERVFGGDVASLGYLHTAAGLGALSAAILISVFIRRTGPGIFILGGNLVLGASLFLFSLTTSLELGLVWMFFTGLALIAEFSVINSTIQHLIDDAVRGRVMSIYVLMWRGTAPIGGFLMGYLAEELGAQLSIRLGAGVVFAAALFIALNYRHIPGRSVLGRA